MDIEFNSVTKRFGETVAIENVTFTCDSGRITGFIGRNGAGKSTALRILLGLSSADSGYAHIGGRPIAEWYPSMVGAVLDPSANPSCTAIDIVRSRSFALGFGDDEAIEALKRVEMDSMGNKRFGSMSLGQKQRVSIAAGIIGEPRVLVLDEPTNGLDPDAVLWMREFLRYLADHGVCVLISSHMLGELDRTIDDVVLLNKTVLWSGTLAEMREAGFSDTESLFTSARSAD